jgi:hypothetical protein
MKHILISSAAAFCLLSSAAFAQPTIMSDETMDTMVAGQALATIENRGGKVVWTVTSLDPVAGYNNGGKGRTENASGGLLNAAGGLDGMANGKGLTINLHLPN